MFRLSLILLCLVVAVTLEYEFKCPYSGEWRFRAVGFNCSINSQYVCIFKYPERTYHETCDGLDYSNIGSKLIYEPFFNKAYCSYERYQPFPFSTDGNSNCVYQKSFCTEKGQYLFQRGSQRSDITCGCDLTKGYEFVTKPNHDCYCVPSEEDCSCHKLPCNNLVDQCPQDRDEMLTRSLFPTYKENGFKDAINIFDDENNGKTYRFQCLYISSVLLAAMIIVVILFFTFVDLERRQYRNNFFRLLTLVVDVANMVIHKYIKERIIGPDSFKTFLNKEKHKLVHIHETSPCCQCSKVSIKGEKLISKKQLQILYKSDERNQRRGHTKYAGNKLIQICICKYSAKENIDVRVVDITLANYIIQKCGKHERGIDNWIEQIKNVRNEIFHLSDLQELTDCKFSTKWTTLDTCIMGIANVIDIECAVETKKHIMQAKKPKLIGDYMLKYEKSFRDNLQNTCAEFERAQNQVIEEKKDCQQTMRRIDSSIAVNISETEEDIGELPDNSVNQQCSTTEPDDNSNAVNVFETKAEIVELPDNSVNQQSSTTESDGASNSNNIIKKEEMGKPPDISTKQKCSTTEPEGLLNAETTIETKEEMSIPTDSSNNQDFSTTEPDEITSTTEEVIVQKSLKNNLPVSANLRQKLKISKKHFWNKYPDISSCIKTGNTLVFIDNSNKQLIICNSDGTDKHHMSLSYEPRYITEIDSNNVAVSCGYTILIINISTRSITSTIKTSGYCYGISYNDNNLYVVIDGSIIHVMDLTGKVIRTIPLPTDRIYNITVDRDRLICIDYQSIYCCSLDGKLMWKFEKDEFKYLRRVTTDNEGNVYVNDYKKDTVICVSDDGKHHKELLTKSDGLDRPYGIYYDKKENSLLVCNDSNGDAFLCDVIKKLT